MRVSVEISSEPLIDYWGFCKSIAQSLCPADERDFVGLDCIVGKIVRHYVPMEPAARSGELPNEAAFQSVLISDDGRPLDRLSSDHGAGTSGATAALQLDEPGRVQFVELPLPYALTDADRLTLEKLSAEALPELRELRYPVSESDAAAFTNAYVGLKDRPAWEPVLVTAQTIQRRKMERDALMRQHQEALQAEFEGRIIAVDSRHVRMAVLAAGYYIPREQAIAYLSRVGISWRNQDAADNHVAEESAEAGPQSESSREVHGEVGGATLSDEQRRAVVERYYELKRNGVKSYCGQTAKEFGVSDRYVRKLVKSDKAANSGHMIGHLLVSGRK